MSGTIRFLLGDAPVALSDVDPTMTVLQWLRGPAGRTGTKEGCAEGDCGACTVALGELVDGRLRHRAVNACILFLPALDGRQLLTVEDLAAGGDLHPVQRAMIDHHASQCGFCTPGFVMSLFARFQDRAPADDEDIKDTLAGNLCRCTGYRPILEAARGALTARGQGDAFAARAAETARKLKDLARDGALAAETAAGRYYAPRDKAALAGLLARHPDACLLAGGTDVGLWVTKQHRRLDPVIALSEVAGLADIRIEADHVEIGAMARYTDILPVLAPLYPDFAAMMRRLGSVQIRNSGTMGGNIANGSPIGDSMPPLIALGAEIVLNRGMVRRTLALEDFFLGYRRTALAPGEFIEAIRLKPPAQGQRFAVYKISKRFDQDISAVCAGFALTLDEGRVRSFRAGFGGMAAIPARAWALEAALTGQPWTLETIAAAAPALERDFEPIDDMRASADYRRRIARNLVFRFYYETTGAAGATRVADHG